MATLLRPRVLLLIGILAVVAVVLFVGITSCINRNNEAAKQTIEEAKPVNEQDKRVAAGVSAAMTSRFTEALDNGDLIAKIAENADQYDDDRLLLLALREPSSLDFIYAYPTSDKSSRPYDGDIVRGETPQLYDWDEHWGAVTYGEGPLAITGSGPTTLAMAYMRFTGKTDFSPTEIAQQASKSNYAAGASGTKAEMFNKLPASMGLKSSSAEVSAETLLYGLDGNTVYAAEVKEDTLTDEAHWVLVTAINDDATVNVCDPTSTSVSAHTWSIYTIASASSTFVSLTLSDEELTKLSNSSNDRDADGGTDADGDTESSDDGSYDSSYDSYDESYDDSYSEDESY